MIGFDITSGKRQRALLLHYGGEELEDIFDTLDNTGSADEIQPAIDALTEYFTPKKNTVYEAIVFRDAVQEEHETVDQFCTRLRKLAKKCDYADTEKEIQIQIVAKCRSNYLRKRALEKERTLSNLLELARTIELAESRANRISPGISMGVSSHDTVNKLTGARSKQRHTQNVNSHSMQCFKCGFDYPHENKCPAEGKECKACGQRNHFARCCRNSVSSAKAYRDESKQETHTKEESGNETYTGNSQVQSVQQADVNVEEYVFAIRQDSHKRKEPQKVKLAHTLQPITDTAKNSYQRETTSKNSYQRETSDKNSYKRDTADKNAYQREATNQNSHQRETMTVNAGNDRNTHTDKETKSHECKSPTREVKENKSPTREVKENKSPTREVKENKSPTREVKENKSPTREVTENKSPTREVKENKSPTREVTENKSPTREVQENKSPTREVQENKLLTREVRESKLPIRDMKESPIREVQESQLYKDVKQKNSHKKKDVKQKNSHKKKDVKQKNSHKQKDVNQIHTGDVVTKETTKISDVDKTLVKSREYGGDMEIPNVQNQEESEQEVNQPRDHHKSKPPNVTHCYVANSN